MTTSSSPVEQWRSLADRLSRIASQSLFVLFRHLRIGVVSRLLVRELLSNAGFPRPSSHLRDRATTCHAYYRQACRDADAMDYSTTDCHNCVTPKGPACDCGQVPKQYGVRDVTVCYPSQNAHTHWHLWTLAIPSTNRGRSNGLRMTRTLQFFVRGSISFVERKVRAYIRDCSTVVCDDAIQLETVFRKSGIGLWYSLAQWPPQQVAHALGCLQQRGGFSLLDYSTDLLLRERLI